MIYIMVKWPATSLFDVYPLSCLCDTGVKETISQNANVSKVKGRLLDIKWHPKKQPSSGYILAAGSQSDMERKRERYAKALQIAEEINSVTHEDGRDCHDCERLKMKLEDAEAGHQKTAEERDMLKQQLNESEEKYGMGRLVKRMKKIADKLESLLPNASSEATKVDIGNGVLVEASTLARIESQCGSSANRYARVLLGVVFGRDNLVGKSLYGVQSNANKGSDVKPALDREKLDAVLGHTCQKFRTPVGPIKNSLSSMLCRMSRNEDAE